MRGFKVVSSFEDKNVSIPQRADKGSAGYDIRVLNTKIIEPGKIEKFDTGLKAYMLENELLELHVRSSIGIKRGLILSNVVGIIDSSYYNNPDNEGHIIIALTNLTDKPVVIEAGERVCQGIFKKYLVTDNDQPLSSQRLGGIGSTN